MVLSNILEYCVLAKYSGSETFSKWKGNREVKYQVGCTILRMSIRRHGLIEMRLNEDTMIDWFEESCIFSCIH